jgi:anti-sigma B factor antagonist
MQPAGIDVTTLGDKVVKVTITGRLDTQGVDRIETRLLASVVPNANNAIIDLSHVDFVASMAIRMFMSAAKSLRQRRAALALYGATAMVNEVFETVSLQTIIPVCSTEAEALAAVSSPLPRP